MNDDEPIPEVALPAQELAPRPPLSGAAQRALAEAQARRAEIDRLAAQSPAEKGGRGGLEPVRYGDWEIKGLTSDF
ncbi:DUF1674 domain-containing protein [Devosia sp. 1566]|uniref:DUF1674 domain-containing protein n=1 Tax=Devosia sp. 1566 TaxID=2499144 RepID=UPI000FD88586|nr:DUF1674 domain-containing protein [Devosia sp. 1566]